MLVQKRRQLFVSEDLPDSLHVLIEGVPGHAEAAAELVFGQPGQHPSDDLSLPGAEVCGKSLSVQCGGDVRTQISAGGQHFGERRRVGVVG